MESAEPKSAAAATKAAKRSRWISWAATSAAAVLLVALSYYGLQYFRSSSFSDERGFRVLREMTGQFANFQEAVAGLLTLVPSKNRDKFLASLSLGGQWGIVDPDCPSDLPAAARFVVDISSSKRPFTVSSCPTAGNSQSDTRTRTGLRETLSSQLPTFMRQDFFDMVILALGDGVALARVTRAHDDEHGVELHATDSENLIVANVSGMLQHALRLERAQDAKAGGGDEPSSGPLAHPVVLTDAIAGDTYRVFIQPFEPAYPVATHTSTKDAPDDQQGSPLYLVAFKRQDLLESFLDTLGPSGTLSITLIVLLGVLMWPLLSLRFSAPQEAIASTQVFAAVIALLLIPVVVSVSGFSLWARHRLVLWADQAAERYAQDVERALISELGEGARTLDHLADQYLARSDLTENRFVMSGKSALACINKPECEVSLTLPASQIELPIQWSSMRSAAPLNLEGRSAGLTLNLFGGDAPDTLALADRAYFRAIKHAQEWTPGELWSHIDAYRPKHGLVAQRLFNRSDAARVLQLAVPMQANGERIGVMTADSRAYALTASIRPPLLRFAVIDATNGVVLFHSDDNRSLAENLLVETEQSSALREAMQRRASRFSLNRVGLRDHFSAIYMGEGHRFHYRPVPGVPWGVVTFYSTESIGSIVLQTAVATLATAFACAAVLVLLGSLWVFLFPGRPELDALAFVWPKWGSRHRYRTTAIGAIGLVIGGVALLLALLRDSGAWLALSVSAFLACAVWVVAQRKRRASGRPAPIDVRTYEKHYASCLLTAMLLVPVLGTLWLAADYHDVSLAAYIRGELKSAARDLQQRERLIAEDLERFMPNVDVALRKQAANILTERLSVPGYRIDEERSRQSQDNSTTPWQLIDVPEGLWLRIDGPPHIGSLRSVIWTLSTSEQAQRGRRRSGAQSSEAREIIDRTAVRHWHRAEDGTVANISMPLQSSDANAPSLDYDDELSMRYRWSNTLLLIALVLGTVIVLTLLCWHAARRLFGIRIPFAGRFAPELPNPLKAQRLLDAELELSRVRKAHAGEFTRKDEQDWRAAHLGDLYAEAWESLEANERLLLHQLAHGYFANPENTRVIERLLRAGYVKLWPWPRIAEAGFADYIRGIEDTHEFQQLQEQATDNLWHRIRTPLLIVVIVIAGLLMWLAGSAMQLLSATLAGMAALFSSITQVTSFATKDNKPKTP